VEEKRIFPLAIAKPLNSADAQFFLGELRILGG
jgi:hypothetical protein